MDRWLRFAVVAAVLGVAGAAVALLGGGSDLPPRAATTPPAPPAAGTCLPLPARVATPAWYPKDLPVPAGSYVSEVPEATAGLRRVVFAVRASLRDFVRHALTEWPKHGWTMGRGEAEPGEAEDNFLKAKENRYGVFRARSILCDEGWTWVLVVLNDPVATRSAPPLPSRESPSPTPS